MPKNGTPVQITDEWREAFNIRMRQLNWSHQDLADKVGLTRPAISNIAKRGDRGGTKESPMVPDIEKALGWERGPAGEVRLAQGTRRDIEQLRELTSQPERLEPLWDFVRRLSPDQVELLWYFQHMKSESRARVFERARTLWEEEGIVGKPSGSKDGK